MNKTIFYNILFGLLIFNLLFSQEIAVITKNNGDVQYKLNSSDTYNKKIYPGLELYNNDLLITGNDGFVMFAYLDDGTLVKIHKDSQVYINGDLKNNAINKKVILDEGFIKFDVKKQQNDRFTVVTPTSVASVKGTVFYIDTNQDGDIFYGIDGIVDILNKESNQISELIKNKKVTSTPDGTISTQEITQKDLLYIIQIQEESGLEIDEIEEDDSGSLDETDDTITNEIVIILTNQSGEEKKLIIKFNEE